LDEAKTKDRADKANGERVMRRMELGEIAQAQEGEITDRDW
jgi:hypothetical protein